MSGIDDLKMYFRNEIDNRNVSQIYLARVENVKPLIISNAFFGKMKEEQIHILKTRKDRLIDRNTTVNGEHSHSHRILKEDLKVGDEVLILLYEQEFEQKFILIDKVVKYSE